MTTRTRTVLVIAAGLATGILTQLGQASLPDDWSPLANAISPWLLVAFLVGATFPDRRSAAVAGAAVLGSALVGYYAMTEIRMGVGASAGSVIRWGLGAVIGGPLFGAAGHAWRRGGATERAVATGLLAAAFVADGLYQAVVVDHRPAGVLLIIVGVVLLLVLGRTTADRLRAAAAAIPALALGGLGFLALVWLDGVAAAVR